MESIDMAQMIYLADMFKVLGDKTRLTILALLCVKSLCVRDLVEILQVSQPSVSQHLGKLKSYGLVTENRKGSWVFYSINRECPAILQLILNQLPDVKRLIVELEQNRMGPAL